MIFILGSQSLSLIVMSQQVCEAIYQMITEGKATLHAVRRVMLQLSALKVTWLELIYNCCILGMDISFRDD